MENISNFSQKVVHIIRNKFSFLFAYLQIIAKYNHHRLAYDYLEIKMCARFFPLIICAQC